MKRLKFAVILLLGLSMATTMTSCKKDNTQSIVGKWEATTFFHFDDNNMSNVQVGRKFIFTSEGLTTFPVESMSFSYEINDNILTIGGYYKLRIDELTSTTLKLSWAENYDWVVENEQCVLKRIE